MAETGLAARGTMRRRGARLREERGVALVEFALVAPLLMLLLFGMIDFGRAFNYWIDETHLANMGARWAAVNTNPCASSPSPGLCAGKPPSNVCGVPGSVCLQEYIVSEADTGELQKQAQACIEFDEAALDPSNPPGDYSVKVTVRMADPFEWIPLVGSKLGIGPKHITASSTMRLEQRPINYTNECSS